MKTSPRSVPFIISILALMALVVVPLSSALIWLGWQAVGSVEKRSVDQRMAALDKALRGFLTNRLDLIVLDAQMLAGAPVFSLQSGQAADDERIRQLFALLIRQPTLSATYAGYDDGHFLFVVRVESFLPAQRIEYGSPPDNSIIVKIVDGPSTDRLETWWLQTADGDRGPVKVQPSTFDPRMRPWFAVARSLDRPAMTEPYRFATTGAWGISAGIPIRRGGVLGLDFTPGTLSRLLFEYKLTPNSIIIASPQSGDVFIESEGCASTASDCLSGDAEVRAAIKKTIVEARGTDPHIERNFVAAGRSYREFVHIMPPVLGRRLTIAAAVPVSELAASSRSLLQRSEVAAVVAVTLAILAVLALSLLLSRSLARIAGKTERIRNLDFSSSVPVRSRITEILRLSETIEQMRAGLEIFGRYVSKDLVRQIMRTPHRNGGTRRDFTVMFTDIEGFSRISETTEPALLFARLSRYFEVMGAAISANRGMIDKYMGDGIMAFWNAPELDDDHIAHACRAALQAAAASRDLASRWRARGRPVFRTRFGLHAGPAIVGNVGARERINYTLVGAVANQASRLEALNKIYGTEILVSDEVAKPTVDRFVWRHVDRIVAAGTTEILEIYEPLGEIDTATWHAAFLDQWHAGRTAYVEGRFDAAAISFRAAAALRPDDGPCRTFLERCAGLIDRGLPSGWDGVWYFDKK